MFDDPFSTDTSISAVTHANGILLACTGRAPDQSTYQWDDGIGTIYSLKVGHQYGKRNRFTTRLDLSDTIANPLDPSLNQRRSTSIYIVADVDPIGYPATAMDNAMAILSLHLAKIGSTAAPFKRVLAGET